MNFLNEIFTDQFIHSLGWTLVHSLWQGALIGFAVALAVVFLHKYTARLRYFINSLGLFAFAAAAMITFIASYLSYTDGNEGAAVIYASDSYMQASQYASLQEDETPAGFSMAAILDTTASYCREHIPLFVTIWLMGMMAMMLRFIGGYALVRRYKTHRVKPVIGDWDRRFRTLAQNIKVNRNVKLLESALVKVPMAIGYLKPVVLIPLGALNGVPAQQMEAILVHELAHIKRRDYLMNLIQSVLEVIFFYHPVVWWLSSNIRIERENICDDIAITQTGNTMEFAKALTNIQEINLGSPALAAGLSGKNKNRLLNRIRRLAGKPKIQSGFAEGFIAASILLISLVGLSAAAMISNPAEDMMPPQLSFQDVDAVLPGISYYYEPVVHPDTTEEEKLRQKQVQLKQEQHQRQENLKAIQEEMMQNRKEIQAVMEAEMKAIKENMKALDEEMETYYNKDEYKEAFEKSLQYREQYENQMREAMQAYEEAMQNAQFNFQGAKNWTLPRIYFEDGKQQFLYDGDSATWTHYKPGYFWYEGDSLHEIYLDEWTDKFANYEDLMILREGELLELEEELEALEEVELPDLYYSYPLNYSVPGSAKRIITEELYEDELIEHGREYIVLIGEKQMLINGEKQSRATFKKYRRLLNSMEESWKFNDDKEFRIHIGR
ncbi:MAG: M56 family metallopeptidase [Bacteroidota bacterium]